METMETAVKETYARGAQERVPELCCPVDYDPRYLEVLPKEILERDYGCGDPSVYLRPGETVLDLGSGAGKICFIASQVVGPEGRVIGVDFNEAMLNLAAKHQPEITARIGYDNVTFKKGRIQDLALDLGEVERHLKRNPIRTAEEWLEFEAFRDGLRRDHPLVESASVDVVVSNCVLNLVREEDKQQLFKEIFRVMKPGGRAVISDIVSDEPVPGYMKSDPGLWSGCISGALEESEFAEAFVRAGFQGVEILKREESPWRVVEGIRFRSITIAAYKMEEGPCLERYQAVIYRGPWKNVTDDAGHTLRRGVPTAVCDKTYNILLREPYGEEVIAVPPRELIALEDAEEFPCLGTRIRPARETKGLEYTETTEAAGECCGPEGCC